MNVHALWPILKAHLPGFLRKLRFYVLVIILLIQVLLVLLIDRSPVIWQHRQSRQLYFSQTRSILHNTAKNPGQQKQKIISLTPEDLTAMANFMLIRKGLEGAAEARIESGQLVLDISIHLPVRWGDYFLNLKLRAEDASPKAYIKQVKAGSIALPKPMVRLLGWWLGRTTHIGRYLHLTTPLFQEIRISDGRLRIVVDWEPEVMGQAQDLVADLADKERLRIYYAKLAEWVEQSQSKRFIALTPAMRVLFTLAKERSEVEGGNPREENRAVLLVLATYANGKSLLPAISGGWEAPLLLKREFLLNKRADAAQHFTTSAVLAGSGHKAFADVVGLAKEFNDTHGGSGFSFIDLAADRAGTLFGKLATSSEESARRVQLWMSQVQDESLFMPSVKDLPENLSDEEFASRYGDTASPEFRALKQMIEDRIMACKLFQ